MATIFLKCCNKVGTLSEVEHNWLSTSLFSPSKEHNSCWQSSCWSELVSGLMTPSAESIFSEVLTSFSIGEISSCFGCGARYSFKREPIMSSAWNHKMKRNMDEKKLSEVQGKYLSIQLSDKNVLDFASQPKSWRSNVELALPKRWHQYT